MSEFSKKIRQERRAKAERLVRTDPNARVDASGYTPPDALDADVKTGARPVSPRLYRRGGKVLKAEGKEGAKHAGRKPRKSGGRALATPDNLVNRDVREANEERTGSKHTGAFKRGGRAKKADGGSFVPVNRFAFSPAAGSMMRRGMGLKKGGMAEMHDDEAEDRALVKRMVKKDALTGKKAGGHIHGPDCECKKCMGGRTERKHGGRADAKWIQGAIKHPGALRNELHVKEGEKIPAKKLEKASHSENKMLAKRANLAKTLRSMHKAHGGLAVSDGEYQGTRPTGGRLARKSGGRAGKGKMNVNIVIGAGQRQPSGMMPTAAGAPVPAPPGGVPVPVGRPPVAGAPMPVLMPMGMPPGGMGGGMGGGAPVPMAGPMGRKAGGRVGHRKYRSYKDMDAGSGGGFGRLEKTEIEKNK